MNRKGLSGLVIVLIFVLFLSACQGESESTSTPGEQTSDIQTFPSPESGKGSVSGVVYSNISNAPLKAVTVRLAEVVRQGEEAAFVLDAAFSPGAVTDENGNFFFQNVDPKEYVLVVGNVEVYQGYEIMQEDDGSARVYLVEDGKVLDLGELRVNLVEQP
jgi:hypothetical protein